jgi:hypothetical protein
VGVNFTIFKNFFAENFGENNFVFTQITAIYAETNDRNIHSYEEFILTKNSFFGRKLAKIVIITLTPFKFFF